MGECCVNTRFSPSLESSGFSTGFMRILGIDGIVCDDGLDVALVVIITSAVSFIAFLMVSRGSGGGSGNGFSVTLTPSSDTRLTSLLAKLF